MYTHNIPLSPTTYPCTHTIYPYPPPHTHVHTQEVKSYPVHCIKVVEKVDEGAFHRKHMFQVVIVLQGQVPNPDTPPEVSLYLQAAVSPYYNIYILFSIVSKVSVFQVKCGSSQSIYIIG